MLKIFGANLFHVFLCFVLFRSPTQLIGVDKNSCSCNKFDPNVARLCPLRADVRRYIFIYITHPRKLLPGNKGKKQKGKQDTGKLTTETYN